MRSKQLSIAVIGAGMGGLAAAATLRRFGMDVRLYEQAPRFARIGAGIQMMPNSMKVLRQIGIEERLRRVAFAPHSHLNRVWDSGEVTRELPMPGEPVWGAADLKRTAPCVILAWSRFGVARRDRSSRQEACGPKARLLLVVALIVQCQ